MYQAEGSVSEHIKYIYSWSGTIAEWIWPRTSRSHFIPKNLSISQKIDEFSRSSSNGYLIVGELDYSILSYFYMKRFLGTLLTHLNKHSTHLISQKISEGNTPLIDYFGIFSPTASFDRACPCYSFCPCNPLKELNRNGSRKWKPIQHATQQWEKG